MVSADFSLTRLGWGVRRVSTPFFEPGIPLAKLRSDCPFIRSLVLVYYELSRYVYPDDNRKFHPCEGLGIVICHVGLMCTSVPP